MICILCL